MTTAIADGSLVRSPHLVLRALPQKNYVAYHELFGNIAWIDRALYDLLQEMRGPTTLERLAAATSTETAATLFDSYFVVRSETEERSLIAEWLKERESLIDSGRFVGALQISSSNVCNFACTYCFADASDRRSPVRQSIAAGAPNIPYKIAEEAIRKVWDLATQNDREKVAVKFLGREPLVNWRVIEKLLQTFNDGTIVWAITTNGSLLTSRIARVLGSHDVRVTVSLDGPPSVNDRLRVLKGNGRGTYAMTESALTTLSDAGHAFAVSSVLSRETDFAAMYRFIDKLAELGADELELTLVMQTDSLRAQAVYPDEESLVRKLVGLYEHARGKGLLVHGDWVDPFHRILATHKFRDEDRVSRPISAGCAATSHQISLEPTGDLFPCRAMAAHYGHIDDLHSVLRSEQYRAVTMRTYFNVPYCRGCELEGFCQGTCLGSLEDAGLSIYHPQEEYCRVYRLATRRLFEALPNLLHSELGGAQGPSLEQKEEVVLQ